MDGSVVECSPDETHQVFFPKAGAPAISESSEERIIKGTVRNLLWTEGLWNIQKRDPRATIRESLEEHVEEIDEEIAKLKERRDKYKAES